MGDESAELQGGLRVYLRVYMSAKWKEREKKMRCLTRFRNWRDDLLYNRSIIRKINLERDCSCGVG